MADGTGVVYLEGTRWDVSPLMTGAESMLLAPVSAGSDCTHVVVFIPLMHSPAALGGFDCFSFAGKTCDLASAFLSPVRSASNCCVFPGLKIETAAGI